MNDTVFARRSIRRFKQIPVTKEQIQSLLDAALVAPSARNGQILRYCVVSSPEKLNEVFSNTAWAGYVHPKRIPLREVSAPTLFIVVSALNNGAEISNHTWADAGAAIENMLLTAVELGLGGCWIGSFNKEKVAELLELEKEKLLFLVALGYKGEDPVQDEIALNESPKYYLDENDVLHIPKYTVDAITKWV